jgi:hypothetical protein
LCWPQVFIQALHSQALLLARATTGSRGIATAAASNPDLDVWLVTPVTRQLGISRWRKRQACS